MYIKTLSLMGFKSYRDTIAVDPFSPHHNVVVGRNGSGKSNFFAAIRFVLSDAYTSMGREERQRLLHEGASTTTTLSAYVEIVFDNADGRFPTSLPEVHLRRTIGLKKDEYSLDRKSVTKAEVMNLLESAGFSRSNPYYIVPQGRITHLTNMSDKERLNLLKEVAGTNVYEQKRAESTRIMEETDSKRAKIAELLDTIEERLDELESEKEELKEYQAKDQDRRCLEYALHQKELDDATASLEKIEQEKNQEIHNSNERRREFNDLEARIQAVTEELTKAKHKRSTMSISLHQDEGERNDLLRDKTEVECIIEDFAQSSENGETRRLEVTEQLASIDKRVGKASERLMDLSLQLEQRTAEERQAKELLDATKSKLQVLTAKQGRARQFRSKAERDKHLADEIKSLQSYEKQMNKTIAEKKVTIEEAMAQVEEVAAKAAEQQGGEEQQRHTLKQMSEERSRLQIQLDELSEKRKELWREDGKLSQTVSNAKKELDDVTRQLHGTMNLDTRIGLAAVKDIAKRLNLDGVYGPLYELFEVSDRYKTAVEVMAGGSLFHVVVDNDETAEKIINVMTKEKRGRVTFLPLNRLKSVNVQYPQANDAVPMISKLKFDRTYSLAFEQIFARTIICADLQVATQYTRSHGLDAVTDEGDRVDRKGPITGGFHDMRRSRLDTIRKVKRWREAYDTDTGRLQEVKESALAVDQQITQIMGEIQKLQARSKAIVENRDHASRQLNWTVREEERARHRLARLEGALIDDEAGLRSAITQRTALEEELQTPLTQQLTPAEVQQLETLTKNAEDEKNAWVEAAQARQKVASERSQLEIELTENLRRRKDELRRKLDDIEGAAGSGVLQAGEVELRQAELRNLTRQIKKLDARINNAEEEIEELTAEITTKGAALDELQQEQQQKTRDIMKAQKSSERYMTRRQTLMARQAEFENAIRDLGVLPEAAFSRYTGGHADKLIAKLNRVNESLKKFAHVNKKALEQYNNFTKQREELIKRREELDASAVSIEELIVTLDQRKDEAIQRTFKQVSKYFEEVFEQLVPSGVGRLIIQKKSDAYRDEETEDSGGPAGDGSEVESYSGVSIKVSFNSKHDEGQRIQQLSGGQKSLVALATVFAIQKCDPAPFYLFDEIDANLDTAYRQAVANMIHQLSRNAQFITTTFRGEMLVNADKYYGVYFDKQKVSTIAVITKEDAEKFIDTAAEAPAAS